jgi:prepilin-type N-terminal cleavage/methylation domain-containing protein
MGVKQYMRFSFGFTIVELLIVIAIIGILSSVILGSLSTARDDGLSAKIKSEMTVLSKRARVDESQSFTFDVVCGSNGVATSTEIARIITSIERFAPSPVVCNSNTEEYAVSVEISSTTHWCVDSVGVSKGIGGALTATDFVCP